MWIVSDGVLLHETIIVSTEYMDFTQLFLGSHGLFLTSSGNAIRSFFMAQPPFIHLLLLLIVFSDDVSMRSQ